MGLWSEGSFSARALPCWRIRLPVSDPDLGRTSPARDLAHIGAHLNDLVSTTYNNPVRGSGLSLTSSLTLPPLGQKEFFLAMSAIGGTSIDGGRLYSSTPKIRTCISYSLDLENGSGACAKSADGARKNLLIGVD